MKLGHSSDWLAIAEGCSSPSAEEGREDLVSFTVACELINHASLLLDACGFVLTPRRGTYLLTDALLTLDTNWKARQSPSYEDGIPTSVLENKYFSLDESIELLGVTVRMRPEIACVELSNVGLVRTMTEQYLGYWMLMILRN